MAVPLAIVPRRRRATPPLLWFVVRRSYGRVTAGLAGLLATFCYPLVFYSSEARGYAAAVAVAVALAVLAYALALSRPGLRRSAAPSPSTCA